MSGNELNVGGVLYQADQVKSHSSSTNTRVDDSGNVSAFTTYYVELKDGTKLTYEAQDASRKATVFQNKGNTKFFGLTNAQITDTPKDDVYFLMGCEFTKIDADRTTEEGFLTKDTVSADTDRIIVKDRIIENNTIQVSHHNKFNLVGKAGKSGKRDLIQLQDDNNMKTASRFRHHQFETRKVEDIL